jgi:hypothetical protein
MVISLDTETYGIHTAFPAQTVFSPPRMSWVDKPSSILLTTAITRVIVPELGPWSARLLSRIRPAETYVLPFVDPVPLSQRPLPSWLSPDFRKSPARLLRWLSHATTILGMNLAYDLSVLCFLFPLIRELIRVRRPLLIDLSYVNFLDNPDRSERSLKAIGPVIGTHIYDKTARDRFSCFAEMADYNGCDTHNSVLAIAELARRIDLLPEPGRSLKLSPFTLASFSDTIHLTIEMSLNGVPIHRPTLAALHAKLALRQRRTHHVARTRHSLLISNTDDTVGSKKSKSSFFTRLVDEVDAYWFDPSHPRPFPFPGLPPGATTVLAHPRVVLTPKTREISHSDANRSFLSSLLPATSPLHRALRCWDRNAAASKINGTYCYPLLFHSVQKPQDRTSLLVPQPGCPWSPSLSPHPSHPEPPPCKTLTPPTESRSSSAPDPAPPPESATRDSTATTPSSLSTPTPAIPAPPSRSPSSTDSPTPSSPNG